MKPKLNSIHITVLVIFFAGLILIPILWGIEWMFAFMFVVIVLAKGYTAIFGTPEQSNKSYKHLFGKCPHCQEKVNTFATRCLHCREEI
jgi:hypothetical protein